jgi:alpha-tubulin suppressor-like RCC1 family protein
VPVEVTTLGDEVARVDVGAELTCAIKRDHTLWCWGVNDASDPLAVGGTGNQLLPATVQGLGDEIVQVGELRTVCARKWDGTVWCWDSNSSGEAGIGNFSPQATPAQVTSLPPVVELAADGSTNCARAIDRRVYCWGQNTYGQLGVGTTTPNPPGGIALPVLVPALGRTVVQLANKASNLCALDRDGTPLCWGLRAVGDGMAHSLPTPIPTLARSVRVVAIGQTHGCAIRLDGTVWCWGDNSLGQLGTGDFATHANPVQAQIPCPAGRGD